MLVSLISGHVLSPLLRLCVLHPKDSGLALPLSTFAHVVPNVSFWESSHLDPTRFLSYVSSVCLLYILGDLLALLYCILIILFL